MFDINCIILVSADLGAYSTTEPFLNNKILPSILLSKNLRAFFCYKLIKIIVNLC